MASRCPLGPPMKGQGGPKMAPRLAHGLKIAQPGRKIGKDFRPYFGSWTASLLQDATRWPKMVTRWLQDSPRWLRGGPSWPKMASRWLKKASRWPQIARRLPLKSWKTKEEMFLDIRHLPPPCDKLLPATTCLAASRSLCLNLLAAK